MSRLAFARSRRRLAVEVRSTTPYEAIIIKQTRRT